MALGSRIASVEIFEKCYKEYYQSLINFARARLRESSDCCEDCVQEAYTVFYNRLQNGEDFEYPQAFLYRTLDNIIKKQKTKIMTEQINQISLDDPDNPIEIVAEESIDCEKYIKILEDSLDEEERYFYMAKYVNGRKIEEIAKESGLSVGAVTMRLSRLRKRLKTLLEDIML